MKASQLAKTLQNIISAHGDQTILIDTGMCLCDIDQVDLGASDEGIIIWAGDLFDEVQP